MTATVTYNGVKALQRVFGHLIGKGVLNLAAHEEGEEEEGKRTASADVLVRFKSCLQTLVTLITHRHEQVKVPPCSSPTWRQKGKERTRPSDGLWTQCRLWRSKY